MKLKVDLRDGLWLVITLVLLSLLGWEWLRANSITQEIRELRTAEQPLQFNSTNLEEAAFFAYYKYGAEAKVDWPSLKPLGIHRRMRITKSIKVETGQQAYQVLFGPQVEVVEDVESSAALGHPVYFIRAKQTPPSK